MKIPFAAYDTQDDKNNILVRIVFCRTRPPHTYSPLTLSKCLPLAVHGRYQFFLSNNIVCIKLCCQSILLWNLIAFTNRGTEWTEIWLFKDVVDCALASRTSRSLTPTLSKRLPLAVLVRYHILVSRKIVFVRVCCQSILLWTLIAFTKRRTKWTKIWRQFAREGVVSI